MILGRDINPQNNVYHLGARIIEVLKSSNQEFFDFLDVYERLNANEKVSFNLFTLSLDWLFLMGVVDNQKGKLVKCF